MATAALPSKPSAEEVKQKFSPWIEFAARAGFAAKGVTYALVGLFALLAAIRPGSTGPRGSRSALHTLMQLPLGQILLAAVALGLLSYALWCLLSATLNPEHNGFWKRISSAGKFVVHLSLSLAALGMLLGTRGEDDTNPARDWSATVMAYPAGQLAIVGTGVGVTVYGLRQLYRGAASKLDKRLTLSCSPGTSTTLCTLSRIGIFARGIVFLIIGVFLAIAGYHANPAEAKGIPEALSYIRHQSYGSALLALIATGLLAYAAYEFTRARYRHIPTP